MNNFLKKINIYTIIVFLISFISLSTLWETSSFWIFQIRDLERAQALASGSLIFWGPELNGGGNLPGSFLYFLMAVPYFFGLDWSFVWWLMILLGAIGATVIFQFSLKRLTLSYALIPWLLVLTNDVFRYQLSKFINPSFLIFPAILFTYIFLELKYKSNPKYYFWLFLVWGISLQLHFSIAIAVVPLLLIIWFSQHKKQALKFSTLGLLISLGPYFIFEILKSFEITLGTPQFLGTGTIFNSPSWMIKNFSSHLKDSSYSIDALGRVIINTLKFSGPAFILLLFSRSINFRIENIRTKLEKNKWTFCLLLTFYIPALFCFIKYADKFVTSRYGLLYILFIPFLSVILLKDLKGKVDKLFFSGLFIITVFELVSRLEVSYIPWPQLMSSLLLGLVLVLFNKDNYEKLKISVILFFILGNLTTHRSHFLKQNNGLIFFEEGIAFANYIKKNHNWTVQELNNKLFNVSLEYELSIKKIYDELAIPTGKKDINQSINGYFLLQNNKGLHSRSLTTIFLENKNLSSTIRKELEIGTLKLLEPMVFGNLLAVPYHSKLSNSFGNLGAPYSKYIPPNWTADRPPTNSVKLSKDEVGFSWNRCPNSESFCLTHSLVKIEDHKDNKVVEIEIDGLPTRQPVSGLIPFWTEAIISPTLIIDCLDKRVKLEVANSIGWYEKNGNWKPTHTFLSPFKKRFLIECHMIKAITFSFERSIVVSNHETKILNQSFKKTELLKTQQQ